MYKEYAKDGLEVLTLNLDKPKEANRAEVLRILTEAKSTNVNLLLAPGESQDAWMDRLVTTGVPYVRVYDRSGKVVKVIEDASYPEELDKLIPQLLKQK